VRLPDPNDQGELDALMAEAWPPAADSHDTATCARRMRDLLLDAEQAGRPWATTILDRSVILGCESIGKRWAKKHNRVMVPAGSALASVARRVGTRRGSPGGPVGWQQCLIETLTWAEIRRAIADIEQQVGTLLVNKEAKARLLALHKLHPTSTCPADAAALEGTTVESVMAGEWAA